MKPWLDDLSEEWVPQQPVAEPDTRDSDRPVPAQTAQSVPPKPRSRLPRPQQSSGSPSQLQVRQTAIDARPSKLRTALAERSLSDTNVSSDPASNTPDAGAPPCASRSVSVSSLGSVLYDGTVAQKPAAASPTKGQAVHDTPEWRRRLLKGDIGYGEQKDLFSPMGLENMFQRPNGEVSDRSQPRTSKLGLLKSLSTLPSSPPPWPSQEREVYQDTEGSSRASTQGRAVQAHKDPAPQHSLTDNRISTAGNSLGTIVLGQRTVSAQIEFDNENFSPVYLTTNIKSGAQPKPIPTFTGSDLADRLRHLGSPPTIAQHPPSDADTVSQNVSQNDSSLARIQDDSLPADLPAGTPDLADVGRFVEMRRGGYSRDGSFRHRPLSPSPQAKRASQSRTENLSSSQANTEADRRSYAGDDTVDHNPGDSSSVLSPITPRKQAQSTLLSPERAQGSGSPLKLFDAHDTFTSKRLQRRLSQLEYKSEQSEVEINRVESTRMIQKTSRLTSVEEVSIQNAQERTSSAATPSPAPVRHAEPARVGTFGRGDFDRYSFPEELSVLSSEGTFSDNSAPEGSPSPNAAPPGSRQPFRFDLDESPPTPTGSKSRRQGLTRVSNPFRREGRTNSQATRQPSGSSRASASEQEYTEGKRGPTSPFKNPTPKRRRTLHSAEEGENSPIENGIQSTNASPVAMQSVAGKKRKDARHEHSTNVADPEVLARRHILRPRNPTPSQRRRDELHAEIMEATEAFILSSPKLNTIREQLNSPSASDIQVEEAKAAVVANEVAAFSMQREQIVRDESRKRSVTTQDFLDEAVKIMDYIRAKGRPNSGLGSLEETESEHLHSQDDLPSTPLSFSRPPSREGRLSAWREPNKHELDPNVMSHLRKYQDKESDEIMGSSFRSLRFSQMRGAQSSEGNSVVVEQNNIRITDNPDRHQKGYSSDLDGPKSGSRTVRTHPSSSSLGQTVATNTSRKSEYVATLVPEAVAHLIPEQIAGMSFDREKNIWVRAKSLSKEHRKAENLSSFNESEDDPFGNIPDLTVDETVEQLLKKPLPAKTQPTAETLLSNNEGAEDQYSDRPTTREGRAITATDTSSVPSKVSNFAWSFPKTETRATSWSDQTTRAGGTHKLQQLPTQYSIPESDELDVEHEIRYFEGREESTAAHINKKARDITISIERRGLDTSDEARDDQVTGKPLTNHNSNAYQSVRSRKHNWQSTRAAQTMPHSKGIFATDKGELSLLDDPQRAKNYRVQLSMSVSAPVVEAQGRDNQLLVPSSPMKGDMTFMLSDLPEFTLNQIDECELPDRVVVKHDGGRFSKALEDRYAQGTSDLVKALQDVAPEEPYWEDLRTLNIHDKGLVNLHRLDEFCYRLEELNASKNGISQVRGIPYTIRRLQLQDNRLTGLTSWISLMNLQHLDISNNDIDSLDGLSDLIHLRTLKADDNKITSLEGLLHLDGLIELSLNDNQLESVDFAKADWKSLTDLSLRGNRLIEVNNVHCLPQLKHLDIDNNCISDFPLFDEPMAKCLKLQSLRICNNGLSRLDVNRSFPRLESLYIDGNSIDQVAGLENLRHLRTFSAREQEFSDDIQMESSVRNMLQCADVRSLYLSINPTSSLQLSQHLLNLQRLEIASMGLSELPDNFGQLAPNLRTLNMNFNSIQDLRPLLNIKRLSELLVAGNKLTRLRTNLAVLGRMTTLSKLDMRENPLTLRHYAPASENRVMSLRHKPMEEDISNRFVLPDGDPEADRQHLERLDFETRLRRRVNEIMLCTQCKNLVDLDGLPLNKARILVKDDIWDRLTQLGVIKKTEISA